VVTLGMWLYPWDLFDHGVERVAEQLGQLGIDEVFLASSYHSVAAILGNNPRRSFFCAPEAALYFEPTDDRWDGIRTHPAVADLVTTHGDALQFARPVFASAGIRLGAWTVCMHASSMAARGPQLQLQSPLGAVPNLMCLRTPQALDYVEALAAELGSRTDVVQLEAAHWSSGPHAQHTKFGTELTALAGLLLSWCVCGRCLTATEQRGGDPQRLRHDLGALAQELSGGALHDETFGDPERRLQLLSGAVRDLAPFLAAREDAVLELVGRAQAVSEAPLEFVFAGDALTAGVNLGRLSDLVSTVRLMAYGPPSRVREVLDGPLFEVVTAEQLGMGLSLLPGDVGSRREILEEAEMIDDANLASIAFYNYGLAPRDRMAWVESVAELCT